MKLWLILLPDFSSFKTELSLAVNISVFFLIPFKRCSFLFAFYFLKDFISGRRNLFSLFILCALSTYIDAQFNELPDCVLGTS